MNFQLFILKIVLFKSLKVVSTIYDDDDDEPDLISLVTSEPSRELKFGTHTHYTKLIKISLT